jgi:hypothetical protein
VGRVVVAMRDSGDELGARARAKRAGAVLSGPGWQPAARTGAMHQGQAGLACWRYRRWRVSGPGCAAEGMAVPLAVKELRPLRGAFGVLDREPLARHRQKGPAGKEPASGDAAQPCTASGVNSRNDGRLYLLCTVGTLAEAGCAESWRTGGPQLSGEIGGSRQEPRDRLIVPGLQASSPAAQALTCMFSVIDGLGRGSVPPLFRQYCGQSLVDGLASEVVGVLEQVPVGVHRLADRGMPGLGLDDLRVEVRGAQRRGIEMS